MALPRRGYLVGMGRPPNLVWSCAWLAVTLALAVGCTGQPSSTEAWQKSSHRALGAAISGLGTARLALEQEVADRAPHSYTVVTVTDAIETSGKEVSSYRIGQPPDQLHQANGTVGEALDDAVSLMAEVRVTMASPGADTAAARKLVDRIAALTKKLDELDTQVMTSPRSVGTQ